MDHVPDATVDCIGNESHPSIQKRDVKTAAMKTAGCHLLVHVHVINAGHPLVDQPLNTDGFLQGPASHDIVRAEPFVIRAERISIDAMSPGDAAADLPECPHPA